jgi:hypothetical protein
MWKSIAHYEEYLAAGNNRILPTHRARLFDLIIKNESMQDFCFARGKVGVCTFMHILRVREKRFQSPMAKYLVDLKLNKSKAEIDSLVLEWYKYASRAGVVDSSTYQLMPLHTSYGTTHHMMAVMPTT